MHTDHVCAGDVAGTLWRCPGGTSVEPHSFLHVMPFPVPCTHLPPWLGRAAASHPKTSLAASDWPARPLLTTCGLVRVPAVTDCLQGTAPVEQTALGAFAEMLGTHIRLFYESDSDTRLFS